MTVFNAITCDDLEEIHENIDGTTAYIWIIRELASVKRCDNFLRFINQKVGDAEEGSRNAQQLHFHYFISTTASVATLHRSTIYWTEMEPGAGHC